MPRMFRPPKDHLSQQQKRASCPGKKKGGKGKPEKTVPARAKEKKKGGGGRETSFLQKKKKEHAPPQMTEPTKKRFTAHNIIMRREKREARVSRISALPGEERGAQSVKRKKRLESHHRTMPDRAGSSLAGKGEKKSHTIVSGREKRKSFYFHTDSITSGGRKKLEHAFSRENGKKKKVLKTIGWDPKEERPSSTAKKRGGIGIWLANPNWEKRRGETS